MSNITPNHGTSFGWTMIPLGDSNRPATPPKALLSTQTVKTKAGHVGQLLVDGEIVRETGPHDDSSDAAAEINAVVVEKFIALFAEPSADAQA